MIIFMQVVLTLLVLLFCIAFIGEKDKEEKKQYSLHLALSVVALVLTVVIPQ